ncbi:cGMP-inhibited 3',5'-cyclic phosphodiesterase A isoform X1 [Tetranychus urticae]|uniref:cGMP-inhibited 3',5'-cyclic phosphodiesterase A isoform X1 n=1 Tax=Tetranychus urticae TaxID=32264 RepID=UPI00077BBC02|nr:cGMP-inhibited 3',5'-cyclic phosphodiesterase A isoform X1 [Tetranychus urticae]
MKFIELFSSLFGHKQPQSSRSSVDVALIIEAHGLVTEMLNDPTLPPHIISGLRAVASLLAPPVSQVSNRSRSTPWAAVALDNYASVEEPSEMPYTGEKLMSCKRGRRNVPPSVLRRMSTSTWSTTTSATGMPTLEPEPSRKRCTNFRSAQSPNSPHPPSFLSPSEKPPPVKGGRSFSTTALPMGALSHLREKRDRKLGSIVQSSLDSNRDIQTSSEIDLQCLKFPHKHVDSPANSPSHVHFNNSSESNKTPSISTLTQQQKQKQPQHNLQPQFQPIHHQPQQQFQSHQPSFSSPSTSLTPHLHQQQHQPSNDRRADKRLEPMPDKHFINPYHGSSYSIGACQILKQTIPRLNLTSDYDSSNDSPSGSETTVDDNVISDSRLSSGVVVGGSGGRRTASSVSKGVTTASPSESSLSSSGGGGSSTNAPSASNNASGNIVTAKEGSYCLLCGIALRTLNTSGKVKPQPTWPNKSPPPPMEPDVDPFGNIPIADTLYNLERLAHDPLLNRINEWDYPIFELNSSAEGAILSQLTYRIFYEAGLLEAFRIPIVEFLSYFRALELGYREKPYHNRMHAADVLHGVYYLTSQQIPGFPQIPLDSDNSPAQKNSIGPLPKSYLRHISTCDDSYGIMGANFPALEIMALYTASAMHDYDHPGRTNAFLVQTFSAQAILYNDRSVLENHHAAAAWSLFISKEEYNWLRVLDKAEFKRFRFLVIEFILATDLKRHFDILAEFSAKVNGDDGSGIDWFSETDRLLVMEMCIKLSDINGPCKERNIHLQWTHRIAEEFYEQGDEEESLGLPISPFMDRKHPQLARLQESFINHLVAPLCNIYGEAGLLPGVIEFQENITSDKINERRKSSERKSSDVKKEKQKIKKITCLQTKHLEENYRYWVNVLKEEANKTPSDDDDVNESSSVSSDDSSTPVFSSNQPLHDIVESEEVGATGETPPPSISDENHPS